ncbi:MAG: ATP-binding cassette domain-containing protein, partial [Planctomycetota bacterium]
VEFVVSGRTLASRTRGVDVPIERRSLGYVPQGFGLFPHLSAIDNVAFGLSTGARRLPLAQRRARARAVLEELGGRAWAFHRIDALSGGEQQRVALARALVIGPELLLLDEPMAALDVATRRDVRQFLSHHLARFARPSVLVTHDIRDVVAFDAHVYAMEAGRIVQQGPVDALRRAPATAFVAEFVGAFEGSAAK